MQYSQAEWRALRKAKGEESIAFFASEYLNLDVPEFHAELYAILRKVIDQRDGRAWILAPKDHGKSTVYSFALIVWAVCYHPTWRCVVAGIKQDSAESFTHAIRAELESNEKLIADFGQFKPEHGEHAKWTDSQLNTRQRIAAEKVKQRLKDPSVRAMGTEGESQGGRADLIACDDIVSVQNQATPALRKKVSRWFHEDLMGMLEPGCPLVGVGTKKHRADLHADVEKKKKHGWIVKTFRAIKDDGSPLWPEKWPRTALNARKAEIGAGAYSRDYMNRPISEEEALFPWVWFQAPGVMDRERSYFVTLDMAERGSYKKIIQAWDVAAVTDKQTAKLHDTSFWVCITLGIHRVTGKRVLLGFYRSRGITPGEAIRQVKRQYDNLQPHQVIMEANAFQRFFGTLMSQLQGVPIRGHETGEQKADLFSGTASLQVQMENEEWVFPYKTGLDQAHTDIVLGELHELGCGGHDDTVMCLNFLAEATRQIHVGKAESSVKGRRENTPTRAPWDLRDVGITVKKRSRRLSSDDFHRNGIH